MIPALNNVSSFAEKVGVPLTVACIGLAATVMAAAITFALGRLGDAASRRRESYSSAARILVSYSEYPYRIRRRASDAPDELSRLALRGHELQEALRFHETWVASDDRWVGSVFHEVREDLGRAVRYWASEAWAGPPVQSAAEMNLGTWGPADADPHIDRFQAAVACRFGWRRVPAFLGWHLGAKPRPNGRS